MWDKWEYLYIVPNEMMQKEKVIPNQWVIDVLNELGNIGWEVCGLNYEIIILKRKIIKKNN